MPEKTDVTTADMLTAWATTSRIAQDFLAVLVDILGCTPWGVPLIDKSCADVNVDQVQMALQPAGAMEVICAGGVFVSVRRMFWHDGNLNEFRQFTSSTLERHWGAELSAVIIRSKPSLGGWAGLPLTGGGQVQGGISEEAMTEQSTILGSDMKALMLAQEVTFEAEGAGDTGAAITNDDGRRVWVPGPVQRFRWSANAIGNLVGWDRTPPIRIHLNDDQMPCGDDCLSIADRVDPA